jgi:hypothetical protein
MNVWELEVVGDRRVEDEKAWLENTVAGSGE